MMSGLAKGVLLTGITAVIISACIFAFKSVKEGRRPVDNHAESKSRFEQTLRRLTGGFTVDDYAIAVESVRSNLPLVREFHKTYPDALSFIAHFAANDRRETAWNSVTTLYDRYELTLKIPIELTEDHREVSFHGDPEFYLTEITKVENLGRGRFSLHSGFDKDFGAETWKEVKQTEGRIEKVFDGIRTDAPVPGFERYKKKLQESRGGQAPPDASVP